MFTAIINMPVSQRWWKVDRGGERNKGKGEGAWGVEKVAGGEGKEDGGRVEGKAERRGIGKEEGWGRKKGGKKRGKGEDVPYPVGPWLHWGVGKNEVVREICG